MVGSMLALLLSALDQTIVGTAMPRIVEELNGLEHLSWVFTAYMLTSTVSIPIFGKLSDIYGRKNFFLGGIFVFVLGSVLSGLSQDMTQLIFFRALQGLGAGGLMASTFATIGDLFPPAERGKWQGLFGAVFGLSSVVGPTLGGWLTDNVSWRWNFFINVPVGIIAFLVILFLMPKIVPHAKDRVIDFLGAAALAGTLVPILLALVWGGNQYPWQSGQILGLLALSAISLATFVWAESRSREPIIPLHFFKNNIFTVSTIVILLTGVGMFGSILYIPLFAQDVLGISATNAGLVITPMTMGIVVSSVIAGQLVSRTGRYKLITALSMILLVVAFYLLSQINVNSSYFDLAWRMVLVGVGLGTGFPIFTLIVQNAFEYRYLGTATAATQLFRSLGGTIGVAVMGSVLNNALAGRLGDLSTDPFIKLASRFQPGSAALNINTVPQLLTPESQAAITARLHTLPAPIQNEVMAAFLSFVARVKDALAASIADVFLVGTFIVAAAVIAVFFLREIPLRKSHDVRPGLEEAGIGLAEEEGQAPPQAEPGLL